LNVQINHLKFTLEFVLFAEKKITFLYDSTVVVLKNNKERQKRIKIEFLNKNVKF